MNERKIKITRGIEWFDKKTEELIGEKALQNLSADNIRTILKIPYDDEDPELYGVYKISQKSADKLKIYMDQQFDFRKYNYYLCCYSEQEE